MTKAERVNRVKNSLYSEDELIRRLPEIDAIYDEDVRAATIRTFMDGCPDDFWEKPTSSTGKYHSPDERGRHGNWLHTKRVFAEYVNISDTYAEAHIISDYERECGKAAALLHDMMKYGWPSERNEHTVSNHDLIGAAVADHIGGCPVTVQDLIATHNGPWADGPTPSTKHQWLFHTADKSAAGIDEDNRAVYFPSEELVEEIPTILTIEVEDGEAI